MFYWQTDTNVADIQTEMNCWFQLGLIKVCKLCHNKNVTLFIFDNSFKNQLHIIFWYTDDFKKWHHTITKLLSTSPLNCHWHSPERQHVTDTSADNTSFNTSFNGPISLVPTYRSPVNSSMSCIKQLYTGNELAFHNFWFIITGTLGFYCTAFE